MKENWNRFMHWGGWKRIFPLPLWASTVLFLLCSAGLVWVFRKGLDTCWPSYILYSLSAYSLAALCCKVPCAVRSEKAWIKKHPKLSHFFQNKELLFSLGLYLEQLINFSYGIFKIITGVVVGSAWIGSDGIYNLTQALIQLFQILRRKTPGTIQKQWQSYRLCGILILLMHLTLTGMVFQMVNWNRAKGSGEIMVIATAAFAFFKLITSFILLAKDRKHTHPIDSSVRMLKLSQAFFAMFSLQAGMLHVFGTADTWEYWLNLAVGCIVCLLTVAMGIYMIYRANREIKTIQEKENGK